MADVLISVILDQLASIAVREVEQEIRLVVGVDEEVQKLEGNLRTVKAVLNDAEKRQATDEAVKRWLKKLEHVCYEMDDVLDEWNTAMIKLEIEKDEEEDAENAHVVKKKVCSFIPCPSCCFRQVDKLFLHHDIAYKIKELSGKLNEIVRERERSGFELTTRGNASEVVERPKTNHCVDVSEIYGRDKVKGDLVSILLGKGSEEEISPGVISIVGMGGIGKTTLAQLVYNDHEVETHFERRMWVCVSEPFDQHRVAKKIIDDFGSGHPNTTELRSLLEEIHKLIGGKKFFLVLDDVWTEDYTLWEPFRCVLNYGAQGSRILVTTRKSRVAEMMGCTTACMINLEVLSEEDCWLMFRRIAFSNGDPEQCKQLEDLGRQIAMRCKGLPLAAKTLGYLMHGKRSRGQWKQILDGNLWELEDPVIERDLFAPLFLSYADLRSPLKQCFSYCATFPKDYNFDIDELVFMWMAQGYIDSKENMEIVGRNYFENLAIRSFFQDFARDEYGNIKTCKMHDLVHDFAQLLTKDVCFTVNSVTRSRSDYRNALHLHLEIPEEAEIPVFIISARKLRTLILDVRRDYNLANLFQHFRCLRTLTLNFQHAKSRELPDAVETFIHLRYLSLQNYDVDGLPKTICNLCNLQILKICSVRFKKLPQGMHKIINLRHLIFGNFSFGNRVEFPRGIGRLTSLRTLSHFFVSDKDDSQGCKLGELKYLNHLEGTLEINGLGNVEDVFEVENAQLKKKIHLRSLRLYFNVQNDRRMKNDELFLNALEPPPNLEYLSINWYQGSTMSTNWIMSLTRLKSLKLCDCMDLEHLPSLGKLPLLQSLSIWNAKCLKKVGVEFLGIESKNKKEDNMQIFPNLKSLEFNYLVEWEEWIGIGEKREEEEDSTITIMPRLQHLVIFNCPSLNSLPDFLRTIPLKELEISCSSILHECCQRGTGEEWPKISHIPNIKIDWKYVQRDGQEVKSEFDSSESNEEELMKKSMIEMRTTKKSLTRTLGECGQSSSSA